MDERSGQYSVLGVRVDAVQIADVIERMMGWIRDGGRTRYIGVTGMHGVTEAQSDVVLKRSLFDADLVVPDGTPLVWIGRTRGFNLPRRVYGPELMARFCSAMGSNCAHYLYGGAPGIADELADVLRGRYGSIIVGTYSPPFRSLVASEIDEIVRSVNASEADVVWVGLSTPKQEKWMHEMRSRLNVPVLVGVGAAFDFLTHRKRSAPRWMQENGLEWLFRLVSEPRRLWRRYLVGGTKFIWWNVLERLGLRSFD